MQKRDPFDIILIHNHIKIYVVKIKLILFFELFFKNNNNTIPPA